KVIACWHHGMLHILVPAPQARRESETDEDFLARVVATDLPKEASDVRIVERSVFPEDRVFRNAWRQDGSGRIDIDMEKARGIQRNRIRAARAPLLAELDVAYQRADEREDTAAKADIAARKQALRDAPADPAIETARTPEELKAVWPLPAGK